MAAEGDFDRHARDARRSPSDLLRARGTTAGGRCARGWVAQAPVAGARLALWRCDEALGGAVSAGALGLALGGRGRAPGPPWLGSVALRRDAGVLELALRGGEGALGLHGWAGRWALDVGGLGSLSGCFRLRADPARHDPEREDGWEVTWSAPEASRLQPTVSARTVRGFASTSLPAVDRRLELRVSPRLPAPGALEASVGSDEREQVGRDPGAPERRVILRTRRLSANLRARVPLDRATTLVLRYRQSGLDRRAGAEAEPPEPPGDDDAESETAEAEATAWDLGRASVLGCELETRPDRRWWAGGALVFASGGDGPASWVPARRPLGPAQWVRLGAGGWIASGWVGARRGPVRLEVVGRAQSAGESEEASRLTVLAGIEIRATRSRRRRALPGARGAPRVGPTPGARTGDDGEWACPAAS
jgi:hypothetical protein